MSRLKINIVLGPFYPTLPGPSGAVETVWQGLGHQFSLRGHEVRIFSKLWGDLPRREMRGAVTHVRSTNLASTRRLPINLMKDFYYAWRKLMELPPADILVTNTFWLPALATRLKRGAGRAVVHVATAPKGQLFLYKKAAIFDTVSAEMERQILAEAPWAKGRVAVSPNPIDVSAFYPPEGGREWNSGKPRTILFTGRVHPIKGLHLLVEAYSRLRERCGEKGLTLRFIGQQAVNEGGGGEDYVRELKRLAGAHPLSIDAPIFDRAKLAEALRQADYYAYPSVAPKGESFGVAPLEAMATGLVPVVSDMGGFRAFMEPGVHGLMFNHVGPDPVGELTAALGRLIEDPVMTARMSAVGMVRAREFSYETVAERHLRDFEAVMAGRPLGGDQRDSSEGQR